MLLVSGYKNASPAIPLRSVQRAGNAVGSFQLPADSVSLGLSSNTPSAENEPDIPDVRGMLASNPRFSKLNLEINKAYVVIASMFQDVYDPDRNYSPSWYGFAPFASRQAGDGIAKAEALTSILEGGGEAPPHSLAQEERLIREFPDPVEREAASDTLSLLGPAPEDGPQPEGIGDVIHLGIAANRLRKILSKTPGSARERLTAVARTTRNMLEDGNRRIISEIGVAGQDYLHFRSGRNPGPEQVLNEFTVSGTPKNPEQARAVYTKMESVVKAGGPLKLDWDKDFPKESFDRSNFLVAGFAAYEAARLETDPVIKNRWVEQAGVLIAFREQFDIVQGAFEGETRPGEVPRGDLMKMITPWVNVPTRNFNWTFRRYASDNLPPADDNPATPRAAEYSWADFETRWGGINNFFDQVNADPKTLWPMPSPNPSDPL